MQGGMWLYRMVVMVMVVLVLAARATQAAPSQSYLDYSGWRVLEVELKDAYGDQPTVNFLELDDSYNVQLLYQNRQRGVAEVALSPAFLADFTQYLDNNNISSTIVVEDLGKKIEADRPSIRAEQLSAGGVTFERYMNYEEIKAYLEELPRLYPDLVRLEEVGRSEEGRPLFLLTVTSDVSSSSVARKPIIFIDGGIHAREWVSPAAVLNIVQQLVKSPDVTRDTEWRLMPLMNPDGYVYSWTRDRLWRKNRAKTSSSHCYGVDLNRNFGFHFAESGSSSRPCSEVFHGPMAFSEPESQALMNTLLREKTRTQAYVSFHAYGQFLLHPWGYTEQVSRFNDFDLSKAGEAMAKAIRKGGGPAYTVGTASGLLYPASGGSDDWAAGVGQVPYVFTIELRDDGAAGFILPKEDIIPTVKDAWMAVKRLRKYALKNSGPRTAGTNETEEVMTVFPPETDRIQETATREPLFPPETDTTIQAVVTTDKETAQADAPGEPLPPDHFVIRSPAQNTEEEQEVTTKPDHVHSCVQTTVDTPGPPVQTTVDTPGPPVQTTVDTPGPPVQTTVDLPSGSFVETDSKPSTKQTEDQREAVIRIQVVDPVREVVPEAQRVNVRIKTKQQTTLNRENTPVQTTLGGANNPSQTHYRSRVPTLSTVAIANSPVQTSYRTGIQQAIRGVVGGAGVSTVETGGVVDNSSVEDSVEYYRGVEVSVEESGESREL